ncbi:MAG: hypothetical protein Q8S06_12305 [Methanobacteriaceae archaeon]|nr:hypothetical protein [Methanobacteriaceae archaeon]
MKYAIVKLEKNCTSSYNLGAFNKEDDIVAFPLDELQVEMMRLKYYLEKSGEMTENAQKSQVKFKKREIRKAKNELEKASKIVTSLMKFETQTSLENFKWHEMGIKKKKRICKDKINVPAIIGI